MTAARAAMTASLVGLLEASPMAVAGTVCGSVAFGGAAAAIVCSRHSMKMRRRLQQTIQNRIQLYPVNKPWKLLAKHIWDVLHWYLSPMKEGMPQVYMGSLWRNHGRVEHQRKLNQVCERLPSGTEPTASQQLWSNLIFLFSEWLEFNPHTANWGACSSYGLSPTFLCWHNRWREDLRHVVSELARCFIQVPNLEAVPAPGERACVLCLLATLDHVLSWNVTSMEFGSSDLLPAILYSVFCHNLRDRFADAWGAAMAPANIELDLVSFDGHVGVMAQREVPDGFRGIW